MVTRVHPESGVMAAGARARRAHRDARSASRQECLRDRRDVGFDVPMVSNTTAEELRYGRALRRHTVGDIFRWCCRASSFISRPFALSSALRRSTGAVPLIFPRFRRLSAWRASSPEILVACAMARMIRLIERRIAPRAARLLPSDKANASDLLADPKELPEHLTPLDPAQRRRPRRLDRLGQGHRRSSWNTISGSDAHSSRTMWAALIPSHDAPRRASSALVKYRSPGAPAPWRSSDEPEKEKRGPLCRLRRLFLRRRSDGHPHRVPNRHNCRDGKIPGRRWASSRIWFKPSERPNGQQAPASWFRAAEEAVRFASGAKRGQ